MKLLAFLLALLTSGAVHAQAFPSKPMRLVVPYAPGGTADILARMLSAQVQASTGQPVVIDNKGGAGTAIGTREVAAAPADGYTMLLGTVSSHAMNPVITPNVGYDPIKDFIAVTPVASMPFAFIVHPSVAAKTIKEFLELAKREPGKLNYASAGIGTSNHLAGELLRSMAGVELQHVPYKGSAPALADLLGGRVSAMFDLLPTAMRHVGSGAARPLAITSAKRSPLLPNVPTFAESGLPQYEVTSWFGIFTPAKTPADAVARLNTEFRKAVRSPEVTQRLEALGAEPIESSAADFSRFVQIEHDKWTKVIRSANVKAE
jgi:tripartite-type tricarboxylate transporter receptor subunit TctC